MGILEDMEGMQVEGRPLPNNDSTIELRPGSMLGQLETQAKEPPKSKITGETPWSEVLTEGAGNIPSDFIRTAGEMVGAVGAGAGHLVKHGPMESGRHLREGLANADWGKIGSQLKHDYLTEEGWKQGIAERPVSRLLDVSMLAAGPEALAARTALKAGHTGLSKGINIASRVHDPAAWTVDAIRGAGYLGRRGTNALAGHALTHTGGESLNLLHEAGKSGGSASKAGWSGLFGRNKATDPVKGFQTAMNQVRDEGYQKYRASEAALKQDTQRMDFTPVDDAIKAAEKEFIGPFAVNPDPDVVNSLAKIKGLVNRQKHRATIFDVAQMRGRLHANQSGLFQPLPFGHGSNPYRDPIAFDELKKAIGSVVDDSSGPSKAASTRIYEAMSDDLKAKAPIYDDMMKDYATLTESLRAYKTELGLSKNPDAALRKLLSSLRNNVSTNFLRRWQLVNELVERSPTARDALYNLAGQANSAWTPRGLIGQLQTTGSGLAGAAAGAASVGLAPAHIASWLHPGFIPLLAAQSPKLMGMSNLIGGWGSKQLGKVPWRPFLYAGHISNSPYASGEQ